MEMSRGYITLSFIRCIKRAALLLLLLLPLGSFGQAAKPEYIIYEGRMIIRLDIRLPDSTLNSFIRKYNLGDMYLSDLIRKNISDTLLKKGWKIDKRPNGKIVLSKQLNELKSAGHSKNKNEKPEQPEKPEAPEKKEGWDWIQTISNLFGHEENKGSNLSGANRFKTPRPYHSDSVTVFYVGGHQASGKIFLAGSFTNWESGKIPMQKINNGWVVTVKLGAGKYYYKFIVDNNWTTDEDNLLIENDGSGNDNSVFYKANKLFTLKGYPAAKRVVLAGSFNNWAPDEIAMEKTPTGWQVPLYLSPGTYTYRFVVDGNWMIDPANEKKVPNEFDDFNSFIAIGNPYVFKLKGYGNAKDVVLAGSFNDWQSAQLHMIKTPTGWELPYVLGPGNYEYKFVVDGNWIKDPANPLSVSGDENSYFILGPNHTFRLKGFADAKMIYLAGDFNNWSPATLLMKREGNEWVYSVYLSPGKHLYKFVVDGKWIRDPNNPLWEDQDNSIFWEEK